ncbi:hypothetical protein C8Q74DRAFT_1372562 [Fomes fomentarius]|nr:hypothetical protein C8Q74DRAFT_1372562 [Fomes fomentarius]
MVFFNVPDRIPAIPEWIERLHWSFAAPRTNQLRNVTAVCSQWRKLALGDSRLWSTFWESSSKFATSLSSDLSRCPAGPLHIFTEARQPTRLMKLVREHATRIRQLHCIGDFSGALSSELALTLLETLKTVDFGLLQHLCLPLVLDEPSALPLVTPVTAATLCSLHLSRQRLPSQCFPSLTRFVFWYPTDLGSPQIETHSLLRFLAGAPNLEVLHLLRLRIQSSAHDEPTEIARQVELCHLRYFTYDSYPEEVDIPSLTRFLSHIRIPAHCCHRVDKIQISQNAPSDDMHALLMQLLGRRNRRRSTLCLDCGTASYSRTDAILEIQPEACEDTGEVTGVTRIRIEFDYSGAAVSQCLDSFLSLSLEQVEEFRISLSGNLDTTSGIMARTWPRLANVRNLAVSLPRSYHYSQYVGILHDVSDPLRASPDRPPACPRLEALEIYVPVCEDPLMESIGQTLASRTEAGFPVRRLAIYAREFAHTTDTSPRRHVTHFDASRAFELFCWYQWPSLRSSQTEAYDPIGTGWFGRVNGPP